MMASQSNEWHQPSATNVMVTIRESLREVATLVIPLWIGEQTLSGGRFERFTKADWPNTADIGSVLPRDIRSTMAACLAWIAEHTVQRWSIFFTSISTIAGSRFHLRFSFEDATDAALFLMSITRT
jgi:hypothetical protein